MDLKMFNAIAGAMCSPDCSSEFRTMAEVWLEFVEARASLAGYTICDLNPLAELLGCEPEMGALLQAAGRNTMPNTAAKFMYSEVAQALNWERTEFYTLDELLAAIREHEQNYSRVPISRAYICSTGVLPVPAGTKIDVLLVDDTELVGVDNPEDRIWDDMDHPRCIKAYRPHLPTRCSTPITTHAVLHGTEYYPDSTILLQTAQLVAWRDADGQEHCERAHRVTLNPDRDGLAAAILSGIAGAQIAPEHIAELRAQMGGDIHG